MQSLTRRAAWLLLVLSGSVGAQDVIELEGTEITGNKELPQVLYIVPWKTVEPFEIQAPPIESILDQELEPIDRAAFKRSIHYHQAIQSKATPAAPAANP